MKENLSLKKKKTNFNFHLHFDDLQSEEIIFENKKKDI